MFILHVLQYAATLAGLSGLVFWFFVDRQFGAEWCSVCAAVLGTTGLLGAALEHRVNVSAGKEANRG